MSNKKAYDAEHLAVLEGLDAVRKRPGMYIGSTDSRGLMHCLWEIIDNSVDEALAGFCSNIDITLHTDGSITVADDGRGIPVDIQRKTGLNGVELVYTKLHAGGKFGDTNYATAGGLHGVGAAVANALAERLEVHVTRNRKVHTMEFSRGVPGTFDKGGSFTPRPEGAASELDITGKAKTGVTGTRVRYWADPQIFPTSSRLDLDTVVQRLRQTAYLVPGLTLRLINENTESEEVFHSTGGVVDFVDHLMPDEALTPTWHIQGSAPYTETVQVLGSNGHLESKEVERTAEVDMAIAWGNRYDTTIRSFVNIIATPKGGTHLAGFEAGLVKSLRKQVEASARRLKLSAKDNKERIEKDDILAGLTAVITVRIAEPQFEGQTKEVLGTSAIRPIVSKTTENFITELYKSKKSETKAASFRLLEKIVGEMRARIMARHHKEISRRKNALESSALPAKLADCRTNDVESSELFIVEGDSALGTARLARNSDYQALFPIRGKILNVQKSSVADMLKNTECANIIQVIGAGSGRSFDLDAVRYSKIVLMTDADVDGAHIRTLLLTLLFSYMRPLVAAGRVYAAVPPLHRIEVLASARKKKEYIYTFSEEELRQTLRKLKASGRRYSEDIQRYKGLGEMDADQLAVTTMDRATRMLRRVTLADADRAAELFELLMGSDVAPRKEFITQGAQQLSAAQIDV